MEAALNASAKLKLDRDLAKSILYQGNMSLGIFEENRHLKRTISDLAVAAGFAGYLPPKRYRLAGELLDYHYAAAKNSVEERMLKAVGSETPIVQTVTLDGWDNASKTHLLGVMAITRRGAAHVQTIDTTGVDMMGADWTEEQLITQLKQQGGADVVAAFILDSPSVNKSALKSFQEKNPKVVGLYCLCHVLSLFLKDVFSKLCDVDEVWKAVHQISKKFRSVKWLRERLGHYQSTIGLKAVWWILI